jgi:hypothetical protein
LLVYIHIKMGNLCIKLSIQQIFELKKHRMALEGYNSVLR